MSRNTPISKAIFELELVSPLGGRQNDRSAHVAKPPITIFPVSRREITAKPDLATQSELLFRSRNFWRLHGSRSSFRRAFLSAPPCPPSFC